MCLLARYLLIFGQIFGLAWTVHVDAARAQDAQKYWIFLDGKPGAASVPVGDRALQRRARRGRNAYLHADRSLSPVYLEALRGAGVVPIVESRWLNAVSAVLPTGRLEDIRRLPFVRTLRPVGRRADSPPPDRSSPKRGEVGLPVDFGPSVTQLRLMNATVPLDADIDGSGVRLGFLDTPFHAFDHPAFDRLRAEGRLIEVRDFVGAPQTEHSHGMSVASVAVGYAPGQLVGPAHGAEVVAGITEYVPSETNQEEDFFVAGLEWLESMGVDVVNVSLGYTAFDDGERSYTPSDLDGDTGITTVAADHAAALGVVVVVSAGNDGCSAPSACWYYIGTPADADSVITVGGVRSDSSRSSFSSYGPTADGRIKPDVAALGSSVYVAVPGGYAFSNGTSFSSPLVAGVVAQMLQVNPTLTPMQVRAILRATAGRSSAPDNSLGWGIVNAAAAVEAASRTEAVPGSHLDVSTFPNPATDEVFVHINAGVTAPARLQVFDLVGRRIAGDVQGFVIPGASTLRIPIDGLASGMYLYLLTADGQHASGTFVVRR